VYACTVLTEFPSLSVLHLKKIIIIIACNGIVGLSFIQFIDASFDIIESVLTFSGLIFVFDVLL